MAEKYGIDKNAIFKRGGKEGWPEQKKQYGSALQAKVKQKAIEKSSDALADVAAEEEARKARIRKRLWEIAEEWLTGEQKLPPADYRRIAQTCMEMGVFEGAGQNGEQGLIIMPEVVDE